MVGDHYFCNNASISEVAVIQQLDYRANALIATLSFPDAPSQRGAWPALSRDEKILAVEVKLPAKDPETRPGFRIFHLE